MEVCKNNILNNSSMLKTLSVCNVSGPRKPSWKGKYNTQDNIY